MLWEYSPASTGRSPTTQMGGRFCGLGSRLLNGSRRDASGQLNSLILRPERQRCHGTEVAPCDCSTQLPAVGVLDSLASVVGRNDSPASGSFREANLQRRLSGGESEELAVATRPRPGIRTSPKPPLSTGIFCEFRCHEAAVRDLTTPATSDRWSLHFTCRRMAFVYVEVIS